MKEFNKDDYFSDTGRLQIEELEYDLGEYLDIVKDETQECCDAILNALNHYSYMEDELIVPMVKHLHEALEGYKENTEIVEHTETQTVTYKKLEYIG